MARIVYFSLDYTPHDHRFLTALAGTEHEAFYVRLQRGLRQIEDRPVPPAIQHVLWAGGQRPFRWRDLPRLTLAFRGLLRRLRPDLVHAGPIQTCAFIAALAGARPLLTMSWGFDLMQDAERNSWWKTITRYTLRASDFFVSDAETTRRKAIAFGMDPRRTLVFPWGVDLGHFRPRPFSSRRAASKNAPFTIFCNRAWEPRYGVDVLARAFVQVAQQRENARLLLLNGGSQAALLRQIFERGNVSGRVTFAGQVSQRDLPRYYHMADLFVSPSYVDGSSVSLLESLACGLPCLVSDIPTNREWIEDEVNGWLFPAGDAATLAARILYLMDNRAALKRVCLAARAAAEAKADWSKNVQVLLEAYHRVLIHANRECAFGSAAKRRFFNTKAQSRQDF